MLAEGYHIERVVTGLSSPRGVAFDNADGVYVLVADDQGSRLLRVGPDGATAPVGAAFAGAWRGVTWHEAGFLVTEAPEAGGRIVHVGLDGEQVPLTAAPACGALATVTPIVGPDGWLYFGQGTPEPAAASAAAPGAPAATPAAAAPGAAVPPGAATPTAAPPGAPAPTPAPAPPTCTLALFRTPPAGGPAERVASGFPHPFDIAFAASGCLYVADTGGGDRLWEILPGEWYGAPGARQEALDHPPRALPAPAAIFATPPRGLAFSRAAAFGHVGEAFVATVDASGPRILRVDPEAGAVQPFAVNRGGGAGRGFGQPVTVRFDPAGRSLYVVDAGDSGEDGGLVPGTGAVWRIWREAEGHVR